MAKTREEYKREAVEQAEETLIGQFGLYEWMHSSGPATFRRVLEGLWDDGAVIGTRHATELAALGPGVAEAMWERDARAVVREEQEAAALRNWDEGDCDV